MPAPEPGLSALDREELEHVRRSRAHWVGTQPPSDGYARDLRRAHSLVRRGLLRRDQFSELVRGERRFYWWAFSLTEKARKELSR